MNAPAVLHVCELAVGAFSLLAKALIAAPVVPRPTRVGTLSVCTSETTSWPLRPYGHGRGIAEENMSLQQWKTPNKQTFEDKLLLNYWLKVGGVIYAEVGVGGRGRDHTYPEGSKPRRIDGLRILSNNKQVPPDIILTSRGNKREVEKAIARARTIEVIEIKYSLDRLVIGQSIVGADLMEMEYGTRNIRQVILCEVGDPLLELVCKKRGIKVYEFGWL